MANEEVKAPVTEVKEVEIKTEDTKPLVVSELEQQIITQLEYYFGDMNYTRDKFLQGKAKENEGWIDLDVLLTFNRLKNLSEDPAVIVAAINKSANGIVEVKDNGDGKIFLKRDKEIVSDDLSFWRDVRQRSVYVKGFPTDSKIGDIEKLLTPFGTLKNVVMRRTRGAEHTFKGSVFACYATKDDCKKLMESEVKATADGEPLIKMMQEEHYNAKVADRRDQRDKMKSDKAVNGKPNPNAKPVKERPEMKFTPGFVVHFSGLAESSNFLSIKTVLGLENVAYVEHKQGETEAFVRLRNKDFVSAKKDQGADVKANAASEVKANAEPEVKAEAAAEVKTEAAAEVKADAVDQVTTDAAPAPADVKEAVTDVKNGDVSTTPADVNKHDAKATNGAATSFVNTVITEALTDGKLMIDETEVVWRELVGDEEKSYYERLVNTRDNSSRGGCRGGGGGRGGGRGRGGRGGGFRGGRGGGFNGQDARNNKRKNADAAQSGEAKVAKPEGVHTKFAD
jgi:lupus La protein